MLGGRLRCPRGSRRLALRIDELRAAVTARRAAPMLEVGSSAASAADEPDHGAPPPPWVACAAPDVLEAALTADEAARLELLRAACPGFFARRGHKPGQLEWLHRRKLADARDG